MSDPEPQTWFTWPDGVFSYECRGCAGCCKGLGIGVDAVAGELERLAEAYPALEAFARLRGSTWTVFNPRDRCWFLDDEGWCRVEKEHGRDAKPASCRLFPFNRVFWVGGVRVVDYNAVICPMRALPRDADDASLGLSGRVDHASILAEIDGIRDPGVVGTELSLVDVEPGAWLSLETRVAERIYALADEDAVDALRIAQTAEVMTPSDTGPIAAPLEAVDIALRSCLETAPRLPGPATLRHALLATPSLRFNELFGRRAGALGHLALLALLPGIWRTWLHLLADGEILAERPLSLQEVTSVWGEVAPLGTLFALWQTPVWLPPGNHPVPEGPARGAVTALARELVRLGGASAKPLGSHAEPIVRAHTVRERIARARACEGLLGALRVGRPDTHEPTTPSTSSGSGRRKLGRGKRKRKR